MVSYPFSCHCFWWFFSAVRSSGYLVVDVGRGYLVLRLSIRYRDALELIMICSLRLIQEVKCSCVMVLPQWQQTFTCGCEIFKLSIEFSFFANLFWYGLAIFNHASHVCFWVNMFYCGKWVIVITIKWSNIWFVIVSSSFGVFFPYWWTFCLCGCEELYGLDNCAWCCWMMCDKLFLFC